MKVVVDTNVYISAVIFGGKPQAALRRPPTLHGCGALQQAANRQVEPLVAAEKEAKSLDDENRRHQRTVSHPSMVDLYKSKVEELDSRLRAMKAIRAPASQGCGSN